MRINVDPQTDAGGFGIVEAGEYRLRIIGSEIKQGPKAPYIQWTFEHADPNIQATDPTKKLGKIYNNTTLKRGENAQFRLQQLCDAVGQEWRDFDSENLHGLELDVILAIDIYNDVQKNVIKTYKPLK
jgi:hypothetical protein